MQKARENSYIKKLILGVGITFIFALVGYLLAQMPGFNRIGPLASAIILAIIYRQIFGYPNYFYAGIQFSSKYLLRLAIILYGLKLNVDVIFQDGLELVGKASLAIAFSILLTVYIARKMKTNTEIALLLGIGTGVCGAAAIAAAAPIIKAKDDETAISIGIIALAGTVFSIIYTLLLPLIPVSAEHYAIWSGLSLHELAHVALAAEPAGEDALAMALLAKLGRVLLLVPLCFILIFWMRNRKANQKSENKKVSFPWFLLGFILMSLVGSYVLGTVIPINDSVMHVIDQITTFLLTAAMVGLGLSISLKDVKTKAFRPLIAMLVTSVLLSFLMFWVAGV